MGKVGRDMSHCVQDMYSVLGCVVYPGWGWEVKAEGKSNFRRVEKMRLKKLGRIESGRGLLSLFVVIGGYAVWKLQHNRFPLCCVIFVSP